MKLKLQYATLLLTAKVVGLVSAGSLVPQWWPTSSGIPIQQANEASFLNSWQGDCGPKDISLPSGQSLYQKIRLTGSARLNPSSIWTAAVKLGYCLGASQSKQNTFRKKAVCLDNQRLSLIPTLRMYYDLIVYETTVIEYIVLSKPAHIFQFLLYNCYF